MYSSELTTTMASSNGSATIDEILRNESGQVFLMVNYVILGSFVGIFGVVSNIINITLFTKQGFNMAINISLLGLTISNLCALLVLLMNSVSVSPFFVTFHLPVYGSEFTYLIIAWPQKLFSSTTTLITAYITIERWLCVLVPLKMKQLVTPKRTSITISLIYLLSILTLVPEYSTAYIDWKFYHSYNRTLLGLYFTSNRKYVENLSSLINAFLEISSLSAVICFTALLVWNLRLRNRKRDRMTADTHQSQNLNHRDKKTIKLVVVIASMMIVCYIPTTIALAFKYAQKVKIIGGRYTNVIKVCFSFGYLAEAMNASTNIFFYYKMSSRYREMFRQLFGKKMTYKSRLNSKTTKSTLHLTF